MKSHQKINITVLLLSLFISLNIKGQFAISNLDKIDRLKNSTTYIVMKDPDSERVKEYVEVFKKYWTISKFEFIKYNDMKKYVVPGNSFFMMSHEELAYGGYVNPNSSVVSSNTSNHIYLELWDLDEKQLQSIKKKEYMDPEDKTQFARIELFTDYYALISANTIDYLDYDGEGRLRNWGPGVLKNYLKVLMARLNADKNHELDEEICNINEVEKLKEETLYVPDYVLIKFSKHNEDEVQRHNEKELFQDYRFKYKLISGAELNQKILNDQGGFYYLLYIKSNTDKYINVINSLTGEIIYSKCVYGSRNIDTKDLKNLSLKIKPK